MRHVALLASFSVAWFLAYGCGNSDSEEGAAPPDGGIDAPDGNPGPVPENCPAAFPADDPMGISDRCGLFVSAGAAANAGDGTMARPYGSLQKAIYAALDTGRRVYVCSGKYVEPIVLSGKVSLFGYFDCAGGHWKVTQERAKIAPRTSPAVRAVLAENVYFDGFEIVAPDAWEPGGSSVGLLATDSMGLSIVNTKIHAGVGGNGADGKEGPTLRPAANMDGAGAPSTEDCCLYDVTGACSGRKTSCEATHSSRPGGVGGCVDDNGRTYGTPSGGISGGSAWFVYDLLSGWRRTDGWVEDGRPFGGGTEACASGGQANTNTNGRDGHPGDPGTSGSGGRDFGGILLTPNSVYVTSDGSPGTDGRPGQAGGGGGGRNATSNGLTPKQGTIAMGPPGSGGGAGGCPGIAGMPGQGGGASLAIVSLNSPFQLRNASVETSSGGAGGRGTFGSAPTAGGEAGPALPLFGDALRGFAGGAGGLAGASGSGGGGPSIGVLYRGLSPILNDTVIKVGPGGNGVPEEKGRTTIPGSKPGLATPSHEF
ncbi:hypothetical protein LVJ94_21600 [Pendulispora rubella]|uniref:DUF1565 domain-containing protein n=1 Tax=Pendulispora rubella TaxID=2741070 RepID=A0ABZ2LFV4_9BACT